MKHILYFLVFFVACFGSHLPAQDFPDSLNLCKTLELATSQNQQIKAAGMAITAARWHQKQSGLLANPELSAGFDEIGGTGELAGLSSMKSSIGLGQTIPMAGKPRKRRRVAESETKLEELKKDELLLELRLVAMSRFLEIHLLQALIKHGEASLALASQTSESVARKVAAGEVPELDMNRVTVELAAASLTQNRQQRELESAKLSLAECWSSDVASFSRVEIDLDKLLAQGITELLTQEALTDHPAVRMAQEKVEKEKAAMSLAHADSSPDVNVVARVTRFRETGNQAYTFETGIELPLFDNGREKRQAAKFLVEQARHQQESVLIEKNNHLFNLQQEIASIRDEYSNCVSILLPAAEKNFAFIRKAYEEGERDLLESIDARRSLIEAAKTESILKHDLGRKLCELIIITGNDQLLTGL